MLQAPFLDALTLKLPLLLAWHFLKLTYFFFFLLSLPFLFPSPPSFSPFPPPHTKPYSPRAGPSSAQALLCHHCVHWELMNELCHWSLPWSLPLILWKDIFSIPPTSLTHVLFLSWGHPVFLPPHTEKYSGRLSASSVNESICFHDVKHHLCSYLPTSYTRNTCLAVLHPASPGVTVTSRTSFSKQFLVLPVILHSSSQKQCAIFRKDTDLRAASPGWNPTVRHPFYHERQFFHQKSNSTFAQKYYKN